MRKVILPLLVFVGGALVGPLLYRVMPLLPKYDLLYYGIGPLIWPAQLIGPLMDLLGTSKEVAVVGLNVLLYTVIGGGIVAAAREPRWCLFAGALLGLGVTILALAAVHFKIRDLVGHDGMMLIALLIALVFYGSLVFLVRLIVVRLQPR
jgi:hypothetical protein